jgi:hypothetical protein
VSACCECDSDVFVVQATSGDELTARVLLRDCHDNATTLGARPDATLRTPTRKKPVVIPLSPRFVSLLLLLLSFVNVMILCVAVMMMHRSWSVYCR